MSLTTTQQVQVLTTALEYATDPPREGFTLEDALAAAHGELGY